MTYIDGKWRPQGLTFPLGMKESRDWCRDYPIECPNCTKDLPAEARSIGKTKARPPESIPKAVAATLGVAVGQSGLL